MGKERVEHLIGSKRKDSKVCKLEITITYIKWLEDFPEHNWLKIETHGAIAVTY